MICLDQVEDTRSALTFLAGHPAVDPERIGVIGSSFGGAVAVYTGGVDERVAAVVSNGGWGDGERKFRGQHKSAEEWTPDPSGTLRMETAEKVADPSHSLRMKRQKEWLTLRIRSG